MAVIPEEDRIQSIFFSEFHPTAGPKITYQVPEDFVSKEIFDSIHVYVITKPQLMDHLISVSVGEWKIMGYPVTIEGSKYPRNALIFNLCFIFRKHAKTRKYEAVVKKLASYLVCLEVETEFLSNETSKDSLPGIMTNILTSLNRYEPCCIEVNMGNTMYLKVTDTIPSQQPSVVEHEVPVFTNNKTAYEESEWDLTTQQILPYVDGFNHIAKIAAESDVNISLVKVCIQNLVHYGVVKLLPIFLYSNSYITTPKLHNLMRSPKLQEECVRFITKHPIKLPKFPDVFMLYSNLKPSLTVKDWCNIYNPHSVGVNERKIIQFGLLQGFIRKIQKYPILLEGELQTKPKIGGELVKYLNGKHNFDEICCKVGCTPQQLEDIIEAEYAIIVCQK